MAEPAESADSDAIRERRARGEEAINVIVAQTALGVSLRGCKGGERRRGELSNFYSC